MIISETLTDRKDFSVNKNNYYCVENCIFTMRNLEPKYTLESIAEIWLYAANYLKVNPNDSNKMFEIETKIVECINLN
jgi:hypothetical protein